MPVKKTSVLLMGQTPPPWHGQAVATQILFEHDWQDHEIHRLRMEFSEEMIEVGRFQWKKIRHLFQLIHKARAILRENPGSLLFYPPASAKWIPFLRDVVFLCCVRRLAAGTIFIFHASGLPEFVTRGPVRRMLGRLAYQNPDVSLEVAQERLPAHKVFQSRAWQWCPCGTEVPEFATPAPAPGAPLTVLFVGSLQEGKGILEILRTAALLKQQGRENDFRFRIVGKWFSNQFEGYARNLQAELDLERMVEFSGQLTGDEKWQAYSQANVFFFPTHYAAEASPIVLMEALGMGLPIISTRWAGIPAMLEGCPTASLFSIQSPADYAAELCRITKHRDNLPTTSDQSRNFYRERFLPGKFIDRIANSFDTAAAGTARPPLRIATYLADQNPGYDRSYGISRMSQVVLEKLVHTAGLDVGVIASRTSQEGPDGSHTVRALPWGTRGKIIRLLTDHFHPLFGQSGRKPHLFYFPKGYLPILSGLRRPSVVTIHDTIIQYDGDHYPAWRHAWEYTYWAMMLRHTLRQADRILTVSQSSRRQIKEFMERHCIAAKEIVVTYEPCLYENLPQPVNSSKQDIVLHLASCEPHKRTAHLVRWWHEAGKSGKKLPVLHLIGSVPREVSALVDASEGIVRRPFLEDTALQAAYLSARALILPSEVEGFGLPALEAYYLGTPVCYVKDTSVEEVLRVATQKGGFHLAHPESMMRALDEVMAMSPEEIHECGLTLREAYSAEKIAKRIVTVFREMADQA